MMDSIASMAMDMSAAQFETAYSLSVEKKVMDTQELAAQEMLQMLPPTQPMGDFIDTYA